MITVILHFNYLQFNLVSVCLSVYVFVKAEEMAREDTHLTGH